MEQPYRYISADSHLEVSPEKWTARVPEQWRDRAPRRITMDDGSTATLIENRPLQISGLDISNGGGSHHRISAHAVSYDEAPGTGFPEQRLKEQDIDNLEAEVLFPGTGGPGFWRGVSNNEAYRAIIRAWNEYCIEEYAAADPRRLIPMGVIPQSGLDDAIAELTYCANAGFKGVLLVGFPSGERFPVPADDKFWEAAVESGLAITTHLSWGRSDPPIFKYPKHVESSSGRDPIGKINKFAQRSGWGTLPLVFSGIFDRLPELTIGHMENQLGWIPQWLDSVDDEYDRHMAWMDTYMDIRPLSRKPSEIILDHTFWSFIFNPVGVKMRSFIGVDKCLWSTDMPHFHSDWPNSMAAADVQFEGVGAEERFRMVRGNVVERFHLDADGPRTYEESLKVAART